MPNLRDIRKRIEASISITKITTTMEKIASVHVIRVMKRLEASKTYHAILLEMAEDLFLAARQDYIQDEISCLTHSRKPKTLGVVFIASDQGLCAGFNLAVHHELRNLQEKFKDITLRYYPVGKKAVQYLDRQDIPIEHSLIALRDRFAYEEIEDIVNRLGHDLDSGQIDDLYMVYTHYMAGATYKVVSEPLFPWKNISRKLEGKKAAKSRIIICHPHIPTLVNDLEPEIIRNRLYKALLESMLCEHIIRRIAMKKATDAAEDMIDELRGLYHKIRKAKITQEVNEMMGTVLALQRD